ncbi:MAG: hypothetical protein WC292_00225 [Clostridia bacterium]
MKFIYADRIKTIVADCELISVTKKSIKVKRLDNNQNESISRFDRGQEFLLEKDGWYPNIPTEWQIGYIKKAGNNVKIPLKTISRKIDRVVTILSESL